jgi:hypothetical protein
MTQGFVVMPSHSHQVHIFSFRRLILREARRFLRSPSFAAGVLVLFLMLIATVSILLLSSWLENLALFRSISASDVRMI